MPLHSCSIPPAPPQHKAQHKTPPEVWPRCVSHVSSCWQQHLSCTRTMSAAQQQQCQPIRWLPASWTVCLLSAFLTATAFVNKHVPDSYMDEPFHVPMTQQYCRGDFVSWDPKITTFPGLYYLGVMYAWLSQLLLSWAGATLEATCSGPYLRSMNAVLAVACIQLAYALSTELQQQQQQPAQASTSSKTNKPGASKQAEQQQRAAGVALVVGLLPTQLFFAFLFYTDVASLLFLLLTELLLVRDATYAAAAAGAAAIGMRQTNAVWVTFLTGAAMLQALLQQQQRQQQEHQPTPANGSSGNGTAAVKRIKQQQQQQGPASELLSLLTGACQHRWQLLCDFWPLLLLPVAFCAFVVVNGSITLGDKEAHAPSAHFMQPLYFGLFTLVNAALLLLQPSVSGRLLAGFRSRPVFWGLGLLAAVAGGCKVAARYSLAHPYLLADNRHYTFYLWRKVVNRHWVVRYCLVPLHVAGWLLLLTGLSATQHWLWVAAFVASCCVTLVPAWLIEFRYFTAPFALAVLHLPPPPRLPSLLTAAAFCCVNAAALYVFALRPYSWVDGSTARFMW